jgi:hypothetical protein
MLNIYTAQYNYKGPNRIDITVKTAIPPWSVFAPTWVMVMNYLKGSKGVDKEVLIWNAQNAGATKNSKQITIQQRAG